MDTPVNKVSANENIGKGQSSRETPTIAEAKEELLEKVISVKRVAKVVKGGKRFSFNALVVVGDKKGHMGYGFAKGTEVSDAIRKALNNAKKNFIEIPLKGSSIPHEVIGHYDASIVMLKPAVDGTGVIAGGPVRAVCEAAGIKNILTKAFKSHNPVNVVKATVDALGKLKLERIPEE
ncbi:MAG: 30S ribosomal protein S5 [Candidatus Omnitrophica bacterium]|nr:30S ribosomal protein S5 [Candidatus Omnitrophota bacterium]